MSLCMKGQGASDVIVTESQMDGMVHQLFMTSPSHASAPAFHLKPTRGSACSVLFHLKRVFFFFNLETCFCMAQHLPLSRVRWHLITGLNQLCMAFLFPHYLLCPEDVLKKLSSVLCLMVFMKFMGVTHL